MKDNYKQKNIKKMVNFEDLSISDAKVVETVNKFKEYGIGIVLTKFVHEGTVERHTLWHDLVYGNVVLNMSEIMAERFQDFVERGIKAEALKGVKTLKAAKKSAFELPIRNEDGDKVKVTWEDLAIFTWASIVRREEVEVARKERDEYEKLLTDRKKNRTIDEIRTEMDERIKVLAAKFDKKEE